jgi:hypothetical protein
LQSSALNLTWSTTCCNSRRVRAARERENDLVKPHGHQKCPHEALCVGVGDIQDAILKRCLFNGILGRLPRQRL